MKKIFTLLSVAFVINANSQSSLLVTNTENSETLTANGIIPITTSASGNSKVTIDIKNNSAATKSYGVKRYDVVLNSTATETASAYFCFAGGCYPDITMVSPNNITLNAGQSASDIHTNYQMLTTDLDEISIVGFSHVKYTFFNVTNTADSIQISIQYNGVTSTNINNSFGFSSVSPSSGTIDPSPSTTLSGIAFSPFTSVGNSSNPVGAHAFSFSGWPVGALNGNDAPSSMTAQINLNNYYSITLTPSLGYYLSLNNILFDVDRTATGSRNYAVRSSLDSYSANLSGSVNSNTLLSISNFNTFLWGFDAMFNSPQSGSKIDLSNTTFQNLSTPVTFRFYSWNCEDAAGAFALDNVVFKGVASIRLTGIGELKHDLSAKFKLYPNPSNDGIVTLESTIANSTIEVLNTLGAVILKQTKADQNDSLQLDLSALSAGTYFVKISANNSVTTEKLIILK